jgi:hypothetical protein
MQWENASMKAELVAFGQLKIEGERYNRDVVIEGGKIRKRDKAPSKVLQGRARHTPLSAAEQIPWGGKRLIIGTGARGQLPIAAEVSEEAKRRGIAIEALPTSEACLLLAAIDPDDVYAILHVTC